MDDIFVTQVSDKYALIDRSKGTISILDEDNYKLFVDGKPYTTLIEEETTIEASQSWNNGNGNNGGNNGGGNGNGNGNQGFGSYSDWE